MMKFPIEKFESISTKEEKMKAEIIGIGTELLLGEILNTNTQYISKKLAELGIDVYYHTVVGDNPKRLEECFESAFKRVDLVITTGGLGPTQDDLSKNVAAKYFKKKMELNHGSLKLIQDYFKRTNRVMPKSNEKQAYFPEGSIIIRNNNGTAPGYILESNDKIIIQLPGPPKEMQPMFEESVIPYLSKFNHYVLESKVLRVFGLGESSAEELISDLIERQSNPTIGTYGIPGGCRFRITAKAKNSEEALSLIKPVEEIMRERFKENVYGVNDESIEAVVAKLLIEKNLTISTAESCTGGMVSSTLINYPGISQVFMQGVTTYSNESKMKILNVKAETLEKFGAVSNETAAEMAEGIAKIAGTNIGISTTGIAGPDGGTEEKPVGLVYLGLYIDGDIKTKKIKIANMRNNRNSIRSRSTLLALDWLRRELITKK